MRFAACLRGTAHRTVVALLPAMSAPLPASASAGPARRGASGARAAFLGVFVFAVLVGLFCPDWMELRGFARDAAAEGVPPEVVRRVILSGYTGERAYWVLGQVADPGGPVDEPHHRVVRGRLLIPLAGHVLRLPEAAVLALAPLGCLVLAIQLAGLFLRGAPTAGGTGAFFPAVVAGASAPVFTSLGWLGYYDSWLAVGLLAAAFSPRRGALLAACVLTPWIDERFLVGLPLALLIRWRVRPGPPGTIPSGRPVWSEAFQAFLVAVLPLGVRAALGGGGGAEGVVGYVLRYVFWADWEGGLLAWGAWSGLRVGWVFVVASVWGWRAGGSENAPPWSGPIGYVVALVLTGAAALVVALDRSRSMVVLLPAVVFGGRVVGRSGGAAGRGIAAVLAGLALALPAHHVFDRDSIPVDRPWRPAQPRLTAENNLGRAYAKGEGVGRDDVRAAAWIERAAGEGLARARVNLAVVLLQGRGLPRDPERGVRLLAAAAEAGMPEAQHLLGLILREGELVPRDPAAAMRWLRRAADQGVVAAQSDLGLIHAQGLGQPAEPREAGRWFLRAARQGLASAQFNLGQLLAHGSGVERDLPSALAWTTLAAEGGEAAARAELPRLRERASPAEQTAAERRTRWWRAACPPRARP